MAMDDSPKVEISEPRRPQHGRARPDAGLAKGGGGGGGGGGAAGAAGAAAAGGAAGAAAAGDERAPEIHESESHCGAQPP